MIRKEVMVLAILKCTECGHDVSSFAERCPNCGCPTSIILGQHPSSCSANGYDVVLKSYAVGWKNEFDLARFISEISGEKFYQSDANGMELPKTIIFGVDKDTANNVVNLIKELNGSATIKESDGEHDPTPIKNIMYSALYQKDEPLKCPRCSSTAVTTTSRGYSLIWEFAGSNKTVNRCGKCGYTWKP